MVQIRVGLKGTFKFIDIFQTRNHFYYLFYVDKQITAKPLFVMKQYLALEQPPTCLMPIGNDTVTRKRCLLFVQITSTNSAWVVSNRCSVFSDENYEKLDQDLSIVIKQSSRIKFILIPPCIRLANPPKSNCSYLFCIFYILAH